jgi:hypothetical protein
MIDRPLRRLFWRAVDALDYLLTLVRLLILDALAGPEPETPTDQQRERDWEQVARAFPQLVDGEPSTRSPTRADRVPTEDQSRSMDGDVL